MTERESFHAAILADPADDTRRMAFADWLDENGAGDQDAARAEFIRLSCTSGIDPATGVKRRCGVKEGRWIGDNWHRLVPSVVAADVLKAPTPVDRVGATVGFQIKYGVNHAPISTPPAVCTEVTFRRGFAEVFIAEDTRAFYALGGLFAQDDPVARAMWIRWPEFTYLPEAAISLNTTNTFILDHLTAGPAFHLLTADDPAAAAREVGWRRSAWSVVFWGVSRGEIEAARPVARLDFEAAAERFVRENPGRSWVWLPPFWYDRGGWVEVTLPCDLSAFDDRLTRERA